jgi:hypothetical protein
MVKLGTHGSQADYDIAETFPSGKLGKGHNDKLAQTRKMFYLVLALILADNL